MRQSMAVVAAVALGVALSGLAQTVNWVGSLGRLAQDPSGVRSMMQQVDAQDKQAFVQRLLRAVGTMPLTQEEKNARIARIAHELVAGAKTVEEKMAIASGEVQDTSSLVVRFRQYLYEEHEVGRFSDRMLRESLTLSRKLERYLVIREKAGLKPAEFTLEMVTDFEKFCVDEYLYASNPKYAELYPRSYAECRYWPKRRLNEEAFRKVSPSRIRGVVSLSSLLTNCQANRPLTQDLPLFRAVGLE